MAAALFIQTNIYHIHTYTHIHIYIYMGKCIYLIYFVCSLIFSVLIWFPSVTQLKFDSCGGPTKAANQNKQKNNKKKLNQTNL